MSNRTLPLTQLSLVSCSVACAAPVRPAFAGTQDQQRALLLISLTPSSPAALSTSCSIREQDPRLVIQGTAVLSLPPFWFSFPLSYSESLSCKAGKKPSKIITLFISLNTLLLGFLFKTCKFRMGTGVCLCPSASHPVGIWAFSWVWETTPGPT